MKNLELKLENCYWINKLEHTFNFEKNNINLVYAKNWSMKTSFAKTFKQLQEWKEPKDEIHWKETKYNIKNNWEDIDINNIFVIKSFEKTYESKSIAQLLVNEELKDKLSEIYKKRDEYLKYLKNKSWLKLEEIEEKIINDFNPNKQTFLRLLEDINLKNINIDNYISNIKYSDILKVKIKIEDKDFQNNIWKYLEKSIEIYKNYTFLEKGQFSLNRLKNVEKQLKKENFFYNDENQIIIEGVNFTKEELKSKIEEIEWILRETEEFKKIEDLLKDVAWTNLKEIIENNPTIIWEFKNLEWFYKKLWQSYILENKNNFNNLKEEFDNFKKEIKNEKIDKSNLDKVVKEFNNRFFVPFEFEIDNKESAILWEDFPKVIFKFDDESLNIEELEKKDTLSQWEKRALYILNILFDIEVRKWQKTLFIIDDIADSFDYKNKYAIIEYLREISEENNFYMIILTHNFDFFRTVQSRLLWNWNMSNCYIVEEKEKEKKLESIQTKSLIKPFNKWKQNIKNNEKNIITLIPFVRNLIEYWNYNKKDFVFLTNLLHKKNDTESITFSDLKSIFQKYINIDDFWNNIHLTDNVFNKIIDLADWINSSSNELWDKIILAIAIRLKAEEYMINKIKNHNWTLIFKKWKKELNNWTEYLKELENNSNQTMKLFDWYIQIDKGKEEILKEVNIMTPENIHLNSFMYEPILDMDILALKELYKKVKILSK